MVSVIYWHGERIDQPAGISVYFVLRIIFSLPTCNLWSAAGVHSVRDLEQGSECIVVGFADDTKVSGKVN